MVLVGPKVSILFRFHCILINNYVLCDDQVWDMRTKACIHTLTGHTNTVACVRCQAANPQVSRSTLCCHGI